MSARKRKGGGLWGRVKRVLCDGNKVVVAVGAFLSAVAAVITAVALLLPGGRLSPEAKIEEANVEQNVLIEQYVDTGGATASTGSRSRPLLGGYRLASNVGPAFARPAMAVFAVVSTGAAATSASSSAASSATQQKATQQEAAQKEDEQVKQELQLQGAQATKEAEQQSEQAKLDEAKALAARQGKAQETGTGEGAGEESQAQHAQKATAEAAAAQATAQKASEEARLTDREAAAVKKEEQAPSFTAPPLSSAPLRSVGDAKVLSGTGAPSPEVEDVIRMAGIHASANCATTCPLRTTVERAIADTSSNLEQAAEEVAAVFRGSRVQLFEHKLQPIGVTVEYTLDFVGYAGKRTYLEWALCSKRSGRPLPREWWRNVIVNQIEPTNEKAPVTGRFWAPIPPARGDYYFRLRVFYNGLEVAHRRSESFS